LASIETGPLKSDETIDSDQALLERARARDPRAIEELVRRHRPTIERMLRRFRVDEVERSELVQDALLQMVDKTHTFRGDAQFSTWLYRVATNAALMRLRSKRRKHADSLDALGDERESLLARSPWAHDESPEQKLERASQARRVERALAALPASYRALVIEHYLADEPLQAIADRLRTTESSVRSKLHRARKLLRDELSDLVLGAAA
jgi:RNA polymerase sigma-70 factor (ECF subfamily)